MKVLLCHSYYTQRGGEDQSFEDERDLLLAHGHRVIQYVRRNDELVGANPLFAAGATLWNRRAARDVARLIDGERPDVLHATNTFPLLSPAVCYAASRRGVAVVQALRNYRLLCANSYLLRDGRPCEDCLGRSIPWPAIKHRCYRDSVAATSVVAAMQVLHRKLGFWRRRVDAFFTLTHFARQKFIQAGLPASRIHVKHNSVTPDPGVGSGDGGYVVFAGRLSPEKGIHTLLDAWRLNPRLPTLKIAGDGPLAADVRAAAAGDNRIQWLGHIACAEANQVIAGAIALVMPSLWYETFGRTIAEAFAAGTPVIASKLGAMAELVSDGDTGWLFEPGSAASLAATIRRHLAEPPDAIAAMRERARQSYEHRFTPAQNYSRLVDIYELALSHAESRRQAPQQIAQAIPSTEAAPA
jgi:glycosyltransferase involved in cell wall biosynthesis